MFTINDVRKIGLAMLNGAQLTLPTPVVEDTPSEDTHPVDVKSNKQLKVKVVKAAMAQPIVEVVEEEIPVDVPVVVPSAPKKRGFKIMQAVTE